MKGSKLVTALKSTIEVIALLMGIFILGTFLWIFITPFGMTDFFHVLGLIIKNAGLYSTLLAGITVTIFYQIYMKEKEIEQADKIKIGEVGYYTLAFPSHASEDYTGDKSVVVIHSDEDYKYSSQEERYYCFFVNFLTSKEKKTFLKNIMAFEEEYFIENQKDIIRNYFEYCERVHCCSPLFCSTKPAGKWMDNDELTSDRYFWLVRNCTDIHEKCYKNFWVSAVTEEGIILFIKIKVLLEVKKAKKDNGKIETTIPITLLQQTTYYKSQDKLCALFR